MYGLVSRISHLKPETLNLNVINNMFLEYCEHHGINLITTKPLCTEYAMCFLLVYEAVIEMRDMAKLVKGDTWSNAWNEEALEIAGLLLSNLVLEKTEMSFN